MLRQCIAKDRTFGVACIRNVNSIGTTAEIYEYTEESRMQGLEEVRVKAKGRQRFKIIRMKNVSFTASINNQLDEFFLDPCMIL